MENSLPVERGATYFDGDTSRATSTGTDSMVGMRYSVKNDQGGHGHAISTPTTLILVRNDSGGTLLTGRGLRFDTSTAKTQDRIVEGYVNAQGDRGLPMDDAYGDAETIVDNDLFYVVEEGPVHINSSTVTTKAGLSANQLVTLDATGRVEAAAASDHVVGRLDVANSTANTNTPVLVWFGAKFIGGSGIS